MNPDKNQLMKTVRDAPQSHLHVFAVSPLTKDSAKSAMNELAKFLARTSKFTIIVVKE